MTISLINSAVVVAAQHFNPSVAGQYWLIQNGIVLKEEFGIGAVFTDVLVQVPTRDFLLVVTPENCQFMPAPNYERQQELIAERMGRFLTLIPHTPFTAVGLNFAWQFFPEHVSINDACRRLFFVETSALHSQFDLPDARFGAYLSMDVWDCRLRVEARPTLVSLPDGQQSHYIQFAFNYHLGVMGRPKPVDDVIKLLGRWQQAADHSREIVCKAIEGSQL
jgi:hypothetical protein